MGRKPKQLEAAFAGAAIVKQENSIALEMPRIEISEGERFILDKAGSQITAISSKLATINRKIERINEELRKDKLRNELKELKRERKSFTQLHRDASNKYNGVLELALRDFPGANLDEKIDNIRLLNS